MWQTKLSRTALKKCKPVIFVYISINVLKRKKTERKKQQLETRKGDTESKIKISSF
jgi:hypothetical protein